MIDDVVGSSAKAHSLDCMTVYSRKACPAVGLQDAFRAPSPRSSGTLEQVEVWVQKRLRLNPHWGLSTLHTALGEVVDRVADLLRTLLLDPVSGIHLTDIEIVAQLAHRGREFRVGGIVNIVMPANY